MGEKGISGMGSEEVRMAKVLKTRPEFLGTRTMGYGGKITGKVLLYNHGGKLYMNEGVLDMRKLEDVKKNAGKNEIIFPGPRGGWVIAIPFKGKIKSNRRL